MKTLLIALFITSFSVTAIEHPSIEAKDHLPYEFRLLTHAANNYLTTSVDRYHLIEDLKAIDAALNVMKKEEQFFFIKAEIYKEILRYKPQIELITRYIEPQSLSGLDQKAQEFKDNQYVRWLIESIRQDLTPLLSSSTRNTYLFQRQSKTPITDVELQKYENKLKILMPWAMLFLQKTNEEINIYCRELLQRSLKSIRLALTEFNNISKNQAPAPAGDVFKLSHFNVRQNVPTQTTDILKDELLETDFNEIPARTDSTEWTPKEEAALSPEIFPTPDPNYTPPASLPKAQNDWQQEYLFPKKDPDYQAPTELPQAKNDWQQEYLYPTPDPDYVPPTTMPVPVQSWESVRP